MKEYNENKIKRLELENFTCFNDATMEFSPGINVMIGENGTGKTHLLKVLYMSTNTKLQKMTDDGLGKKNHSIKKSIEKNNKNGITYTPGISAVVLNNYYPTSVRIPELYNKKNNSGEVFIKVTKWNEKFLKLRLYPWDEVGYNTQKKYFDFGFQHHGIFIPSQEMLSWYKGFISSYENRESSIDPTYYHLAKALEPSRLKGSKLEDAKKLIAFIEQELNIEVQLEGDVFYIYHKGGSGHQAALEASGINKLAQFIYLILNGSLTSESILFWDEPEANLNPKYILIVAKFLQTLSSAGCQIFVATHDYMLPYELSLSNEYENVVDETVPDMKFFALYKAEFGTKVETADTMPDLQHDSIMEGLGSHHNREDLLFRKSVNKSA